MCSKIFSNSSIICIRQLSFIILLIEKVVHIYKINISTDGFQINIILLIIFLCFASFKLFIAFFGFFFWFFIYNYILTNKYLPSSDSASESSFVSFNHSWAKISGKLCLFNGFKLMHPFITFLQSLDNSQGYSNSPFLINYKLWKYFKLLHADPPYSEL